MSRCASFSINIKRENPSSGLKFNFLYGASLIGNYAKKNFMDSPSVGNNMNDAKMEERSVVFGEIHKKIGNDK